eukprot:scaffold76268_cov75-Phaeocystis_antarctica.AAC.1
MQCSVDLSLVEVHIRKWDAQGQAREQDRHVVHVVLGERGSAVREHLVAFCCSTSTAKPGGNVHCHG